MTEKRFILTEQFNELQGVTFVKDECVDVDTYYTVDGAVDLLNSFDGTIKDLSDEYQRLMEKNKKLKEENKQLKSSFTEFAKMIEFDMDKGIEVYPKTLLEYIINISKEFEK